MTGLSDRRAQIDKLLCLTRSAKEREREEGRHYRSVRRSLRAIQQARRDVQSIAQAAQELVHSQLAGVVTRCLQAVWGESYQFRILFDEKRGRTEARFVFCRKDGLELDPLEESSGGVVDVAAFALRLVCIVMAYPRRRRLVVLDEPFKNVRGVIYQQRVREMVEQVCTELGFQVILNTDLELLQTGRIVSLGG